MTNLVITVSLVEQLIKEQFPEWASLSITPVPISGHDNRTFRLGDRMLVRLPSALEYATKVEKEQRWLPFLGRHLSIPISQPLALGKPSSEYPSCWSIYTWLEGVSPNQLSLDDTILELLAVQLAYFLKELQTVDTMGGPVPGLHNYYRGSHLSLTDSGYNHDTRLAIKALAPFIDVKIVTDIWEKTLQSRWHKKAVWIHGDVSSGNFLVRDGALCGVIDFGGAGIGDPACDLVIAWTFFKNESRKAFKKTMDLDKDTWARARGWALWKALFLLNQMTDKNSKEAHRQLAIIDELVLEDKG